MHIYGTSGSKEFKTSIGLREHEKIYKKNGSKLIRFIGIIDHFSFHY